MKVALYARVSTPDQSVEPQLSALRDFATKRGFEIAGEYADTVTGSERRKASKAPQFERLMNDARRRKIDGVLVWKLDRFARSVKMLTAALEEFKALGVDFISLTETIDTSTPQGKFYFVALAAVAELERELTRERVRSALAYRRAKGLPAGGPQRDFALEARMCNLRDDGVSIRKIALLTGRSRGGVAFILKRAYNRGQA